MKLHRLAVAVTAGLTALAVFPAAAYAGGYSSYSGADTLTQLTIRK